MTVPRPLGWLSLFVALVTVALVLLDSSPTRAFGSKAETDTVWVKKNDGSKSCEKDSGLKLEDGANELTQLGVKVLESRKTNDGMMHIQVCGAATGSENAYRIPKDDVAKVQSAGYRLDPALSQGKKSPKS